MSVNSAAAAAAKFFAAAIEQMQEGYDWDGADLQETCKTLGLTKERLYDPATDGHMDASDGDMVWIPTERGQSLLNLARSS